MSCARTMTHACSGDHAFFPPPNHMLCRNNVTPDATAYSVLIQLAERAGRPGVAASLQVEMAAQGIAAAPSRLGGAKKGALPSGAEPAMHVHATRGGLELQLRGSSLVGALQAAAAAGSLGDVVMLVEEAVGKGVRPDQDVFGAVLAACHSCGESALGLQVHRRVGGRGEGKERGEIRSSDADWGRGVLEP